MVPSQLGAHLKKWEAKHPHLVPSRGLNVIKKRGLYFTFVTCWMFFVLLGFSSGIFSIFIYDFVHGFAFYGIVTILVYLLSPIIVSVVALIKGILVRRE